MSRRPLISIICPIYNVENYLARCIDSVLRQTYSNFELILVDDGSNDSSPEIAKRYEALDDRVIYFRKSNGGLSDARNFGLRQSNGKYITFLDSDDFLSDDYVTYLFNLIDTYKADISICNLEVCTDVALFSREIDIKDEEVFTGDSALIELLYNDKICVSVTGKLFNVGLFDGVEFPFKKKFEDVGTTYKLFKKAQKVVVGYAPKYYYYMRPDSITHTSTKTASAFDRFELAYDAYSNLCSSGKDVAAAAEYYMVTHALSSLKMVDLSESTHRNMAIKIKQLLLSHRSAVLHSPRSKARDIAAIFLLSFGLPVYQFAWEIYSTFTRKE